MDYTLLFATTTGIVFVVNAITQFVKMQFPTTTPYIQYISWGIGILLAIACQLLGLGLFMTTTWIQAIIVGLGAAMASNGTFDTGLIDWIVSLFKPKPKIT